MISLIRKAGWAAPLLAGVLLTAQAAPNQPPRLDSPGSRPAAKAAKPAPPRKPKGALVNVNSATKANLMKLPGVDTALADRIIANRPYLLKTRLVTLGVLPEATLKALKDRITVGKVTEASKK